LRYSLLDDRYVEVVAGQAAQRGEVCGECSGGCILTITTTISKLHHIAFCPSIQIEHPSCRNDRICCASVSASVVQSCCHFDHKQTEQMRRILPSIHQSISSQTFPTQAPTTSGPSLRFEILIRDATPMRTMARMRQPRTIGSTDISALLFRIPLSVLFPFVQQIVSFETLIPSFKSLFDVFSRWLNRRKRLADHQDEIADGVAEVTQAFIHPSIHCLLV